MYVNLTCGLTEEIFMNRHKISASDITAAVCLPEYSRNVLNTVLYVFHMHADVSQRSFIPHTSFLFLCVEKVVTGLGKNAVKTRV